MSTETMQQQTHIQQAQILQPQIQQTQTNQFKYSDININNYLNLMDNNQVNILKQKKWKISFSKTNLKNTDSSKPELYFNKFEIALLIHYAQLDDNFLFFPSIASRSSLDSLKLFLKITSGRAESNNTTSVRGITDLIYLCCSEFKETPFNTFKNTDDYKYYSMIRQFDCPNFLDNGANLSDSGDSTNLHLSQDELDSENNDLMNLYDGQNFSLPSHLSSSLGSNTGTATGTSAGTTAGAITTTTTSASTLTPTLNHTTNNPLLNNGSTVGNLGSNIGSNIGGNTVGNLGSNTSNVGNIGGNIGGNNGGNGFVDLTSNATTQLDTIFSLNDSSNNILSLLNTHKNNLQNDINSNFNNFLSSLKTEANKLKNIQNYSSPLKRSNLLSALIANVILFDFNLLTPPHCTIKSYVSLFAQIDTPTTDVLIPKMLNMVNKNLLHSKVIDKNNKLINLRKYITTLSDRIIPLSLLNKYSPVSSLALSLWVDPASSE